MQVDPALRRRGRRGARVPAGTRRGGRRSAASTRERLCVDPGIGFGKTLEHNLALLRAIDRFRELDAAAAGRRRRRKRFIGTLTGADEPADGWRGRRGGRGVVRRAGADIVRVHDVRAMRRVVRVVDAIDAGGDGVNRSCRARLGRRARVPRRRRAARRSSCSTASRSPRYLWRDVVPAAGREVPRDRARPARPRRLRPPAGAPLDIAAQAGYVGELLDRARRRARRASSGTRPAAASRSCSRSTRRRRRAGPARQHRVRRAGRPRLTRECRRCPRSARPSSPSSSSSGRRSGWACASATVAEDDDAGVPASVDARPTASAAFFRWARALDGTGLRGPRRRIRAPGDPGADPVGRGRPVPPGRDRRAAERGDPDLDAGAAARAAGTSCWRTRSRRSGR